MSVLISKMQIKMPNKLWKIIFLIFLGCAVLYFTILRPNRVDEPSWQPITSETGMAGDRYSMDDAKVVAFLKERLVNPPGRNVPLNLTIPWPIEASEHGWPSRVIEILDFVREGFFVEVGAGDGETLSNTLMLERQYKWTGLLVEADPHHFRTLLYKRRKVTAAPMCLSFTPSPRMVPYFQDNGGEKATHVQCFPLYTFLLAINKKTVDYLSLDTNGNEIDVLRAIPWDKVNIRTVSVGVSNNERDKTRMRRYMKQQRYYTHEFAVHDHQRAAFLFVKHLLN